MRSKVAKLLRRAARLATKGQPDKLFMQVEHRDLDKVIGKSWQLYPKCGRAMYHKLKKEAR